MSNVPEVKNAKREPFDLGEFNEELAGQTIDILRNPTRGFRVSYVKAALNSSVGADALTFMDHLAVVLGVEDREAVQAKVDDMPDEVFHWLFLYTLADFNDETQKWETAITPRLIGLWEEHITAQVKARAAQGKKSL